MTPFEAAVDLHDAATLWSIGYGRGQAVVEAACDALVAGLDSPALRMLAALSTREADREVPELLPAVLEELGLSALPKDSLAGRETAARALAARLVSEHLTPRELASHAHRLFGHELPIAERLAELDDEYDTIEYSGRTPDEVDADITAEAHLLADGRVDPSGS